MVPGLFSVVCRLSMIVMTVLQQDFGGAGRGSGEEERG